MASAMADMDMPIALRRGKRRSSVISLTRGPTTNDQTPPATPSRQRNNKRARFSAPDGIPSTPSRNSSGLTPFIKRATLKTPRRAASTSNLNQSPSKPIQFTPLRQRLDDRTQRRIRRSGLSDEYNKWEADKKDKKELQKELAGKDEEIQRLIQMKDEELQRLKDELTALKSSNAPSAVTEEALYCNQKNVESELEDLRQSFGAETEQLEEARRIRFSRYPGPSTMASPSPERSDHSYLDDSSLQDGEGGVEIDEDIFMIEPSTASAARTSKATMTHVDTSSDAELLAMALEVESAKKEKSRLFREVRSFITNQNDDSSLRLSFEGSVEMPNADEHPSLSDSLDSIPSPPKDFYANLSKSLKSTTHRAETAEVALQALENDLRELGFVRSSDSATSIIDSIRSHFRSARLELERILPGESSSGLNDTASVLPECIAKLKVLTSQVNSRAAEFRSMHEQHRNMKGNFECALEAAEKANRRIKELEDAIEESAEDMLNQRMKVQAAEKETAEKEHSITTLVTALEKYRGDVSRLEALVLELESSQASKALEDQPNLRTIAELQSTVASKESALADRAAQITELQNLLETTQRDASQLQSQVTSLSAQKTASETTLSTATTKTALATFNHDTQLAALNTRISCLSTALTASETERERLDDLVKRLKQRVEVTSTEGFKFVDEFWNEVLRSATKNGELRKRFVRGTKVREANWQLEDEAEDERASGSEGPMTPCSLVRFVDVEATSEQDAEADSDADAVEGMVEIDRGRSRGRSVSGLGLEMGAKIQLSKMQNKKNKGKGKRRSWDSGIGMRPVLEEGEESSDADAELLSSDSGFDIHEDDQEELDVDEGLPESELDVAERGM